MHELGPPWSIQQSLKSMADDAGVDFDVFLAGLKNGKTDEEIAIKTGVSPKAIGCLREHFEKYGIDSIVGQD